VKSVINLLLALLASISSIAQIAPGQWRDHFSYHRSISTTSSNDKIFVASQNGIFWYNPIDGNIGKINKVSGLSSIGIKTIAYSPFKEMLLVGYSDGNIDIVLPNRVVNIPFIKDKPMIGSKEINHFYFIDNEFVLVSTSFGIVVLNTTRFEIKDTNIIGPNASDLWVNETLVFNGNIYAATDEGLYFADANAQNLFHFAAWSRDESLPNPATPIKSMAIFKNKIVVAQNTGTAQTDILWYHNGSNWIELNRSFSQILNIAANEQKLIVSSRQGIGTFQSLPGSMSIAYSYTGYSAFSPNSVHIDRLGNIAVADNTYGLMYKTDQNWVDACPVGPNNNNSYFVASRGDDVLVAAGSRNDFWGNQWYPFSVHSLSNNQWSTYQNPQLFDAVRILVNPNNQNEYFVAGWGSGVARFVDNQLIEVYTPQNSSLQTIISGPYCRVSGMAYDSKGNLWMSNVAVSKPISVRLTDGTWVGFSYENQIGANRLSDMIMSPAGHLWLILPSGVGLFVLNPGSDPASISDDAHRKPPLFDSQGNALPNDINSIAFDRSGYLWIGTSDGVIVSYNPGSVFEPSRFSFQRVKVPDIVSGLAVYLLENEVVTTIAVDGGNRKWMGTQRSGLVLQSADGTKQLKHFTVDNSPLPSNNIQHVAVHPTTGEVFIATDKGLVSFRGDATEPAATFGKVYAFPNPVRPNFTGNITITGLVENTIVKITDVSGNLVYETTSQGGQATWNGKDRQGRRVATGVYLFFCSDSMGEQSAVGKILFIR
jgi:sugar lactone lactonase YvrE